MDLENEIEQAIREVELKQEAIAEEFNLEQAKGSYAFYITDPINRRFDKQEEHNISDAESRKGMKKISEMNIREEIKQLAQYIWILESEENNDRA